MRQKCLDLFNGASQPDSELIRDGCEGVKAKDPPWYAVLREAWRVLLLQIYVFFLYPQNISNFVLSGDRHTYSESVSHCPCMKSGKF